MMAIVNQSTSQDRSICRRNNNAMRGSDGRSKLVQSVQEEEVVRQGRKLTYDILLTYDYDFSY